MANTEYSRAEMTALLLLTPSRDGKSCFSFFQENPYLWASGIHHPVYTDNRRLQSMPGSREIITQLLIDEIGDLRRTGVEVQALAAVHSSAIYHADGIARELDLPMITVRPREKDHGAGGSIDGIFDRGINYLVIEDLFSTGGSTIKVAKNIRQAGGKVTHALSIVTYGWPETYQKFQAAEITPVSLVDFPVMLKKAAEMGQVNERMMTVIADWQQNPMGWAKKHGFEPKTCIF